MDEIGPLVIRAADGSAALADRLRAFGQIVLRFQDMAYGCAYVILGDFHLAEDASQEAFLTAYRQLPKLRQPKAFAGWLRQIVISQCHRFTRRKRVLTAGFEGAATLVSAEPQPAEALEQREMKDNVLDAIRVLPEHQRMATTLFYINGYSQRDIAEFLEVPITTVKKRLHDLRSQLKERMIAMVERTLHDNAPDERFSKKVIEELLNRPRPLEIEGHPIRDVLDTIRAVLPEYEFVEGEEILSRSAFLKFADTLEAVYHDETKVLRRGLTVTLLQAAAGQSPPVRIVTAGRVFRPGDKREDAIHLRAYHQLNLLCVENGVDIDDMKSALYKVLEAVLGPVELTWVDDDFTYFEQAKMVIITYKDRSMDIAGSGMVGCESLRRAGYDAERISAYTFGLGLDRLAMLKYGIDDVRKLWQPPSVPK